MRESLERLDWLPARHGVLLESAPVHRPNELYDTSLQMFVVEGPRETATREIRALMTDARFTQLEPNLVFWEERYARILAARSERRLWPLSAADEALRERYYRYVEAQHAEVQELLRRLYANP
jgi:hypothetical protein